MIPYGRQSIDDADIRAVIDVLKSDFLTQGPAVPAFEAAVLSWCGARRAVAVNSATGALHIACLALGVGPGDVVWTSPITFVASANCALYCGASVDFVDIDPHSFNLDPVKLEEKLRVAEAEGRLPKVVIPVHMGGQSCDMAAISALAARYGFKIIEDASHAIGGGYRGAPVGNCAYSDITVFSFHPVKIITTAEGGMALTNDDALADRLALLRSHGITRDPGMMCAPADGPWYYEQLMLGYNYRMTDMQAALGSSQMGRIGEFVSRRRQLAQRYDRTLADLPLSIPEQDKDTQSSYHLYVVRLDLQRTNQTHREVFDALRAGGIGVNLHYMPVYLQPYYKNLGFSAGLCPEAERYYAEAISIPLHAGLSDAEQDIVIDTLSSVLR